MGLWRKQGLEVKWAFSKQINSSLATALSCGPGQGSDLLPGFSHLPHGVWAGELASKGPVCQRHRTGASTQQEEEN